MSLLAFLGLRHPVRMLPTLLFEVAWKAIWVAAVPIPHLVADDMDGATGAVLFILRRHHPRRHPRGDTSGGATPGRPGTETSMSRATATDGTIAIAGVGAAVRGRAGPERVDQAGRTVIVPLHWTSAAVIHECAPARAGPRLPGWHGRRAHLPGAWRWAAAAIVAPVTSSGQSGSADDNAEPRGRSRVARGQLRGGVLDAKCRQQVGCGCGSVAAACSRCIHGVIVIR